MFRIERVLIVLIGVALAAPVFAQEDDGELRGIDKIVVTAERRSMSLQDVAQSITALTAAQLERANVEDIHDLSYVVPSLQVTGGLAQPTLRGIGQDVVGPATDPGFVLHINGAYTFQLANALLGFHDMERVEVLPGPTGIEYGRATTGGTMNFIWHKAQIDEWSVKGEAAVRTYDGVSLRGHMNFPIVEDKVAGRIAVTRTWPVRSVDAGGTNQKFAANGLEGGLGIRGALRFTPTENLTADLIVEWTRNKSPGSYPPRTGPFPVSDPGRSTLFGGPANYNGATPQSTINPQDVNLELRQAQRMETIWAQFIVELELGDFLLRSNSSYQMFDFDITRDQDGSDIRGSRLDLPNRDLGWSQELSLSSEFDGPFNFIIGANYQENRTETKLPVWDYQQQADAANFVIQDLGDPLLAPANICNGPCIGAPIDSDRATFHLRGITRTEQFGTFIKLTYDVTDQIKLTAGGRYSYTHRDFNDTSTFDVFFEPFDIVDDALCPSIGIPIPVAAVCYSLLSGNTPPGSGAFMLTVQGDRDNTTGRTFEKVRSWNSVDWLGRVEYAATDEVLLYGYISTGERHGGFNWLEELAFDPESITAYEIGWKTEWFDRSLILNGSVFYYDYKDKFVTETINNTPFTENIDKSKILGVDLQFWYAPTPELLINGSIGYLHTEIQDWLSQDNSVSASNPDTFCPGKPVGDQHGVGPTCDGAPVTQQGGNSLSKSPEWTVNVTAAYTIELASGTVVPSVSFSYRHEFDFRNFNNPLDRNDSFTKTDVRLRYNRSEGDWWIEGFVENLENRDDVRTNLEGSTSLRQFYYAPPRVFGVRAGMSFAGSELAWVD